MLTEGGGGVHEPLILADVICEQPLSINMFVSQAKLLMEISFSDILSKLSVRRVSVDGDVNQIDSLSLIFGSKTIQVFPKRRKL